jgi:hypothetical protein
MTAFDPQRGAQIRLIFDAHLKSAKWNSTKCDKMETHSAWFSRLLYHWVLAAAGAIWLTPWRRLGGIRHCSSSGGYERTQRRAEWEFRHLHSFAVTLFVG